MASDPSSTALEPGSPVASPRASITSYTNNGQNPTNNSSGVSNESAAAPLTLDTQLASHNQQSPLSWLQESWLKTVNRYERIATASPRVGVGLLGHGLLEHYSNLLPTLGGSRDFLPMFNGSGAYLGVRPKIATWPLSKEEAYKNRTFAS